MKILLAADGYNMTNGVAHMVVTLADKYREEGHSVKLLALSESRQSHREEDRYFISSFSIKIYPDTRQTLIRRHPYLDELIAWKPDIIHTHTEGSVGDMTRYIARKTGAPLMMTMHTDWAKFAFHNHSTDKFVHFLGSLGSRIVYRHSDLLTTPSPKAQALLKGYLPKHRPVVVVPNGIKLNRFQQELTAEDRAKLLEQYVLRDNGKILSVVSRISSEKNLKEILEYMPGLHKVDPEIQLLIAGDGPDKKHLERLAYQLDISENVTFTGMIPAEKVYQIYKLGNVFLSASTFEMHSLTYLEAMACGLPLICRDDPCLEGVLFDGENGFRYRTQEEFTESVIKLVEDSALRAQMSENALQTSLTFSDTACAHKMLDLYKKLSDFKKTRK